MVSLDSFFGLHEFDYIPVRHLFRKFATIAISSSFAFNLSATFMVLYMIDTLGYSGAATITAIMLATQLVFDYPFGSMGDWIGQRWVIISAVVTYIVGFVFLSYAQIFSEFIIVGVLFGFSNAQASGTFQSWLDNQYKRMDVNDPERKNYGFTMTRINAIASLIMGITFIIGGILSTQLSRAIVFRIQAIVMSILTVSLYFLMTEVPIDRPIRLETEEEGKQSYMGYLIGGLKFAISSRVLFIFILSIGILQSLWTIWGNLILFPFYFAYAGSDSIASLLRSIIFFTGVLCDVLLANATRKVKKASLSLFQSITLFGLFTLGGILLLLYPAHNSYNLLGLILVYFLMLLTVSLVNPFVNSLFMRVTVDLIPSENRNAMYSLIPSISAVFAIPMLPLVGSLIEKFGLQAGFFYLLALGMFGMVFFHFTLQILLKREKESAARVEGLGTQDTTELSLERESPTIPAD